MVEFTPKPPVSGSPARWALIALRIVAIIACLISGYLLAVSFSVKKQPLGCGAGLDCAAVLSSRYSMFLGLPVAALAMGTYFAVLVASFFIHLKYIHRTQQSAWTVLIIAAGSISAAAMWFTGLQAILLEAFCSWCLVDHALGFVVTFLILCQVPLSFATRTKSRNPTGQGEFVTPQSATVTPVRVITLLLIGTALTALVAGSQVILDFTSGGAIRLPVGEIAETGNGPGRRIAIAQSKLQIIPHEMPVLGSPDARKLVIVLFDYCCPYCRDVHHDLVEALKQYPDQFAVILLPVPMNGDCNVSVSHTQPQFQDSCELARLALAIWRADHESFAEFDRWLFESEKPRNSSEAHAKASELVGAAALEKSLQVPWIESQIHTNVQIYANSGADRIPVILSANIPAIVGKPEGQAALIHILRDELKLESNTEIDHQHSVK